MPLYCHRSLPEVKSALAADIACVTYGRYLRDGTLAGEELSADKIERRLSKRTGLGVIKSDIETIAARLAEVNQRRAGNAGRAYVALRTIGRPAHYSEVTEAHNTLFPHRELSEQSIETALNREKFGVVWVGMKGIYALGEWGYERPRKTLFETVRHIVKEVHARTGRPVPLAVILAEIGKYRQMVNLNSVRIAAFCNHDLREISKGYFVPKGPEEKHAKQISTDKLHRILEEFAGDC